MTFSPERIAKLRDLIQKASDRTPLPWDWTEPCNRGRLLHLQCWAEGSGRHGEAIASFPTAYRPQVELISEGISDLPDLLDEVKRLRQEITVLSEYAPPGHALHSCGGPSEACMLPGCPECGCPTMVEALSQRSEVVVLRQERDSARTEAKALRQELDAVIRRAKCWESDTARAMAMRDRAIGEVEQLKAEVEQLKMHVSAMNQVPRQDGGQ